MPSKRKKTRAKHLSLYEKLFGDIISGKYAFGERIPNELELVDIYGVSRPTVAKAVKLLEQKGFVSRKQGVGTFVRKPDSVAQQKIGLLMPRLTVSPQDYGHFVSLGSMIVAEISTRANANSYVLLSNDLPHGNENQIIQQLDIICQQLIDLQVKGVFFMPFELSGVNQEVNTLIADKFRAAGITVVLLDRDIYNDGRRSGYDIVTVDNKQGAYELTKHLIGLGCKKIDFITSKIAVTSIEDRIEGYERALANSGMGKCCGEIHKLPFLPFAEQDAGFQEKAVDDLLSKMDSDAVVCVNDRIASIVMKQAIKAGLKIPEDFKIVGFDDEPFGAYLPVPLTTMRQPALAIGAEAMRALISKSKEPEMPPRKISLNVELVIRQSCGSKKGQLETLQGLNGEEVRL